MAIRAMVLCLLAPLLAISTHAEGATNEAANCA